MLRQPYLAVFQIWNPLQTAAGIRAVPWFLQQARACRQLPGAEPLHLRDIYPQLHDHGQSHGLDPHYFYLNVWAIRRVLAAAPVVHDAFDRSVCGCGMFVFRKAL